MQVTLRTAAISTNYEANLWCRSTFAATRICQPQANRPRRASCGLSHSAKWAMTEPKAEVSD